jgi:hypothetical protein
MKEMFNQEKQRRDIIINEVICLSGHRRIAEKAGSEERLRRDSHTYSKHHGAELCGG